MENNLLKNNTKLINNFINKNIENELTEWLDTVNGWDLTYKSRKTISFGKAYIGDRIHYSNSDFPEILDKVVDLIEKQFNFKPNNCLVNYYYDGDSKMGYHSDNVDFLKKESGILIVSLNDDRILKVRSKLHIKNVYEFLLSKRSIFYMSTILQTYFTHSIVEKKQTEKFRISLTFRQII